MGKASGRISSAVESLTIAMPSAALCQARCEGLTVQRGQDWLCPHEFTDEEGGKTSRWTVRSQSDERRHLVPWQH